MKFRIYLLCCVLFFSSSICYSFSFENKFKQNNNKLYEQEENNNVRIYEKIIPSVVTIEAELPDGLSSGAGCIIDKEGTILTSSHVILHASYIKVKTNSGDEYKGMIIPVKKNSDALALIKIEPKHKLDFVTFADSSKLKVGQKVLAIGHPFGFSDTLTTGIVSRIDKARNRIQTDAAINPGSSGGPICNTSGEVIGISQSIFNPDNNQSNIGIGFAIPANDIVKFIKEN